MDAHWFSDFKMEEPSFFHQWEGDCFDQLTEERIALAFSQDQNQELCKSSSCKSNTNTTPFNLCPSLNVTEIPKNIVKTTSRDSGVTEQTSLLTVLSFGASDVTRKASAGFYGVVAGGVEQPKEEVETALPDTVGNVDGNDKTGYDAMVGRGGEGMRKGGNYTGSNQQHVIAERKRRETLCQRFIALSKIVPGLKKMDKATVLGDAINYLTQLQGRVRDLEAQSTKRALESATENFQNQGIISNVLPEIVAKITEQTVLIKIHCKSCKGALVKVLEEIEALGLSVTSTNVIAFAGSYLDITATAQVEEEFSMNVKDVVKKLNQAFKQGRTQHRPGGGSRLPLDFEF